MTATSLLLPLWALADSQLQAAPQGAKMAATAHVDFRIVIPKVLSLGVAGGENDRPGAQRVAIFSNGRNVTLAASGGSTGGSTPAARNNVILRAAAGRVIAREAACQLPPDTSRGVLPKPNGMICTVSMP